eukprot:TRINITY_DN949_c0_g1_i1.p1 TRINITY_DN949_c0_g1~~TRINITY_DN949_c0_g1_i1.p1  ORF type:complete len:331 (+),score=98.90 TRINITY_DN949_c0_g1_i1:71-1063(+)
MSLKVTVVEAKNIKTTNTIGKGSNAYCEVLIKGKYPPRITQVVKKAVNPAWNQNYQFGLGNPYSDELEITLKGVQSTKGHSFLGYLAIPINTLFAQPKQDNWYHLGPRPRKAKKKVVGEIHLVLEYSGPGIVIQKSQEEATVISGTTSQSPQQPRYAPNVPFNGISSAPVSSPAAFGSPAGYGPPSGGFAPQPLSGGFSGGYSMPVYQIQPSSGGFPAQPSSGGFPAQPSSGGFPAQIPSGGFPAEGIPQGYQPVYYQPFPPQGYGQPVQQNWGGQSLPPQQGQQQYPPQQQQFSPQQQQFSPQQQQFSPQQYPPQQYLPQQQPSAPAQD